jgi:nucleotide-binding universal stress UspA family protein
MIDRRPLGNVVVATDLSAGGRRAVERAARLPITAGSTLTLVHVVARQRADESARREAEARDALARDVEWSHAVVAPGVDVRAAVCSGEPAAEIARRADAERAELIVVGRHGEHGWRRGILGSTAERVLRTTRIGVLVVAAEPTAAVYRRALVAVDHEGTAAPVIALLAHVLMPGVKELLAVHVLDDCTPEALPAVYSRGAAEVAQRHVAAEKVARATIEGTLDALCGSELAYELRCVDGPPASAILDASRAEEADLVAVGTHGRTGLGRLMIGSIAAGVIRDNEVDTLVARAAST